MTKFSNGAVALSCSIDINSMPTATTTVGYAADTNSINCSISPLDYDTIANNQVSLQSPIHFSMTLPAQSNLIALSSDGTWTTTSQIPLASDASMTLLPQTTCTSTNNAITNNTLTDCNAIRSNATLNQFTTSAPSATNALFNTYNAYSAPQQCTTNGQTLYTFITPQGNIATGYLTGATNTALPNTFALNALPYAGQTISYLTPIQYSNISNSTYTKPTTQTFVQLHPAASSNAIHNASMIGITNPSNIFNNTAITHGQQAFYDNNIQAQLAQSQIAQAQFAQSQLAQAQLYQAQLAQAQLAQAQALSNQQQSQKNLSRRNSNTTTRSTDASACSIQS